MRIAVDAMGGDFAPAAVVDGAVQATADDGVQVLLVGQREKIERELARHSGWDPQRLEVIHATDVVGMDETATVPLRRKPDSSLRVAAELVKSGRAQAMVTAGNTGAAMVVAKKIIGTVPGVDRPALAAVLPNAHGRTVLLDVGANVDTKPSQLREFAVMGHSYAQEVLGILRPRIGLLSIGEEASKGSDQTREVFKVLSGTGLRFLGNVEGRDIWNGAIDVVVCDGFVGNAVLKSAEAVAELFGGMIREEIARTWRTRLGYLLAKPAIVGFRRRTDYAEYGAAPLLGVDGGCFIGHGRSSAKAIKNAIRRATEFVSARVHVKIRAKVAELHNQEAELLGFFERRR
jgi:glycerol-3-phosphate acyltransferase PlsX